MTFSGKLLGLLGLGRRSSDLSRHLHQRTHSKPALPQLPHRPSVIYISDGSTTARDRPEEVDQPHKKLTQRRQSRAEQQEELRFLREHSKYAFPGSQEKQPWSSFVKSFSRKTSQSVVDLSTPQETSLRGGKKAKAVRFKRHSKHVESSLRPVATVPQSPDDTNAKRLQILMERQAQNELLVRSYKNVEFLLFGGCADDEGVGAWQMPQQHHRHCAFNPSKDAEKAKLLRDMPPVFEPVFDSFTPASFSFRGKDH